MTSKDEVLAAMRLCVGEESEPGAWLTVDDPVQAANWARFWRPEIQGYIHSYRATTGVDVTTEVTDERQATLRSAQPSVLLRERLAVQQRQLLASQPGVSIPSVSGRGWPLVRDHRVATRSKHLGKSNLVF